MRGLLLVVLVLLAFPLGCLSDVEDPTEPALSDQGPSVVPWGLTECRFVGASVPVAADDLRDRLPPGFEPEPFLEVDGSPATGLGIEALRCEQGAGLDGPIRDLAYGSIFTGVQAPDGAAPANVTTFFKWETLVPDPPRRGVLQAAGVPAVDGEATVDRIPGPDGQVITASLLLDGLGRFEFTGALTQPREGITFDFIEFAEGREGLARWEGTATAEDAALATGTITIPEGSWVAELTGSTELPVLMGTNTFHFEDARVVLAG